MEIIKKLRKLKSQNLFQPQKLSKSEKLRKKNLTKSKNLSKSWNSLNFGVTEAGHSFLILDARIAFNHLWLAFTKAPIF